MTWISLFRKTSCLFVLALSVGAVASDFTGQRIVITGSSTVAPLALEIGRRFESLHRGVRVDVQAGGSSRGIADVRSGSADIGMASRALKSSEQDLFVTTIALDGVALILNTANPIEALPDDVVKKIYTGSITSWKQIGGSNKPIVVVNKAEGHSTLGFFLEHFGLRNQDIKASVIIGDNQQGLKTVAGNPNAIGYVSIGSAEYEASSGAPIKLLPMAGVSASVAQVQAGKFPLARPLNLITSGQPHGLAKAFIEFAKSATVNDLVAEQYFVPIGLVSDDL